jgi:sulfite exporter TauE/SafE
MALSVIVSAWLVGLLGGVHCLAMCGGFVAAAAMRDGGGSGGAGGGVKVAPLVPARTLAFRQLGYHAGRVGAYALLGAAFGAAGATALRAAELIPIQRTLYVVANGFLVLLALSVVTRHPFGISFPTFGISFSMALQPLQRAGAKAFGAALPMLQPLLRQPGMAGRVGLGIVWGFVPCALVYGTLPLALFTGSPVDGALVMLAFGLGTLPNLMATQYVLARGNRLAGNPIARIAAAVLVASFGAFGIYRALYDPAALAHGPFCL